MNDYQLLIDLAITFLQSFTSKLENKLPTEVLTAVQAAVDALATHKDDALTKANFEAQRG